MTENQIWLSRRYLTYKFFSNLWFLGAIWLYFYRIFITDQQVGVLDGMAFAIGLLAEVPSGALADKFGRDKMVKLGQLLVGASLIIQASGSSFAPFFVGQSIMMIGIAFVSGADEALFFDRLKFDKDSHDWRRLLTRGQQARLAATLSATVIGGLIYNFNPRLPWFMTGAAFLISVAVIWSVNEPRVTSASKSISAEVKEYLADIKTGFLEFKKPNLWIYVPLIVTVLGLFYAVGYGLLRLTLLGRFGFTPFQGSLVIASSGLITIAVLGLVHRYSHKISERRMITTISIMAAAAILLAVFDVGRLGYVVILALYVGEYVLHPFMSEVINYHAPDRHRATVLSVASFLGCLPYVVLAPVIGYLSTHGKLSYFLVVWSVLIALSVVVYLGKLKSNAEVQVDGQA